jgi:hypothetical protein
MDLSNQGIKEWFENKEDAEYAMMQFWVPDRMTWYDVSQWKIQLKPDTWPNPNFDTLRNNMDVILGKKKINGLNQYEDLRDRIVKVGDDHTLKSYPYPDSWNTSDYKEGMYNWERQDTIEHGGFQQVPRSYKEIIVATLDNSWKDFELIKLAYGLGMRDMDDIESSDTLVNQIYQKALGYVAFEQLGRNPLDSGDHQYAAFVIPKKLLQKFPSNVIVYRGQSVSPYSMEDGLIKDGVKYVRGPNSHEIVWRLNTSVGK